MLRLEFADINEIRRLRILIQKYKFQGTNFTELCKNNELAAHEANYKEAAGIWNILPNIFEMNQKYCKDETVKKPLAEQREVNEKRAVMKFNDEGNAKSPNGMVNKKIIAGLIIKTYSKYPASHNEPSSQIFLNKLSETNYKQRQPKAMPLFESVPLTEDNSAIDAVILEVLHDQIQYFADKNEIVTAATLAVILWKHINLPREKFLRLITEYKGMKLC
eukprot:TRINITY_DN5890_c0_g1_i4.p1 TRINITY_DN5890_c0_g1~~TRINITY_DN5890_c0_g1_i4.p1  ORF type:complete len:219 (+),score=15.40 TRINITY_DN5890_c0_g1_i4:380-1036(+)